MLRIGTLGVRTLGVSALLIGIGSTVAGCSQAPPVSREIESTQATQPPTQPVTRDAVLQARISGVFDQPVNLKDGVYEGEPYVADGAARPGLRLVPHVMAIADVDGRPGEEAVALLSATSGGSGERIHLTAIAVHDGQPVSLATTLVGDRTKIRSLSVTKRTIVLEVVESGPSDPACCPTQLSRKSYTLTNGTLTLVQSDVTGTLSASLLEGDAWTVVEIDGQPLPAETTRPTVLVNGTSISGFSGCNRYTGSFTAPAPGSLSMGPIAGTRMTCQDPAGAVERAFLSSLAKVSQYSFLAGRVSLFGMDGATMRSLLLSREP